MKFLRMSDLLTDMKNHILINTTEINDFTVGSATRAILEAVSIEIEEHSMVTRQNIMEGIETGVFRSFGFPRREPTRAFGVVRILFHNPTQRPMIIPRGTSFSSSRREYSQVYETVQDYRVTENSSMADVEVYCRTRGSIGNVPERVINIMRNPVGNVSDVENLEAFQTGEDEEPLEELRSRFRAYIESRGRATSRALEYGIRSIEGVSGVYIDERIGVIYAYVHDKSGNLTDKVKSDVEDILIDYRPAGIPVQVYAVEKQTVNLAIDVTLVNRERRTEAFSKQIENVITNYINGLEVSQDLILSELKRRIKNIDSRLIYDMTITSHATNVEITDSSILRAGTVTVNFV